MAKLTKTTVGKNTTVNKSGHKAYKMTLETKLVSEVTTSFYNEPKFYGDTSKDLVKNAKTLANRDQDGAQFVANLAVYARNVLNLRTVSQVLVVELANSTYGRGGLTRLAVSKVAIRVDDMVNIFSYQVAEYGKPFPNGLKKGIADAFKTFDEYQLAKYNRKTDVKLRDILRICHVVPTDKNMAELFGRVLNDTLVTPYTWETQLSEKGNTAEVWQELIGSKKLGYMATLRNLNNMLKANVGIESMNSVYSYLKNPTAVKNSRQLPFRFYSAYRTVQNGTTKTYDALEEALEISVDNIEKIGGMSAIAGDSSGSMGYYTISNKSSIKCSDISALMLVMANRICDDAVTLQFDSTCRPVPMSKRGGMIAKAKEISNSGGATNCASVIDYLLKNNIKVDRIIMFSDNESNGAFRRGYGRTVQNALDEYRRIINPDVWMHAIDLRGYGTVQVLENDPKVNLISGWSEKLLEFISLVEAGADGLTETIKNYEI